MGNNVVSIDIGSRNMHFVVGSRKGKAVRVKRAFNYPTPPNTVVDGKIEDKYTLKNTIKSAFHNNKVRAKNVTVCVQGSSVIIRDLTLPVAKKEQLAGAIAYEMEQYVSIDGKNNLTEFRVVDEVIEDGVSRNKIKVATMAKDIVDNYYGFIRDMRMNPAVLDVHSNAISKIFSGELDINGEMYKPEGTIAVVDFGYKTTHINIITRGVHEFSRLISYGSRDLDLVLANHYNITPAEAEVRKMEEIQLDSTDGSMEDPDSVYASLRPSLAQLVRELQKVIQYYTSRSSTYNVEALYIYGGGSRIKGFDKYLKQVINLNKVIKIESISSPTFIFDSDGTQIDDYLNALGAIVRL